jgi:NADP-dependent 3-hydroxy acid dehydrogenase YdfG
LSQAIIELGENVIVTARNPGDIADIGESDAPNVLRLPLDVTNDLQIDDAVARGLQKFGAIDVLVNNAGYGYFATQEEGELDEVRKMYDVNVFGLIRMTQAVIPHMRKAKSGTIVNLSSMAGRMGTPRGGFYQSTKWAVEAISESLYLELSSFGVRVILIEPGSYTTDFSSRSAVRAAVEETDASPYNEIRKTWVENATTRLFPWRQNPNEVVEAIIATVNSRHSFVRVPVGQDAVRVVEEREEKKMDPFVEWMRKLYHGEEVD